MNVEVKPPIEIHAPAAWRPDRIWSRLRAETPHLDRLIFATDRPHWHYDDPAACLSMKLTEAQRRKIFAENASTVYRLS